MITYLWFKVLSIASHCHYFFPSFWQMSDTISKIRCVFRSDPRIDTFFDFSIRAEMLMSLSHSFHQMKAENQNFPQITRIWLENWHLRSRINLWCKHRLTNVVLSLCWQMSKLTVWHFWSISIRTYRCIHLSKNGGSKVLPLMIKTILLELSQFY